MANPAGRRYTGSMNLHAFLSRCRDKSSFLWRSGAACRTGGPRCAAEALAAFGALAWATRHAFLQAPGTDVRTYFLIPPLLWVVLRFGPLGAILGTMTVSVVSVWHTVNGTGPFALPGTGLAQHVLALQGFLGVTALCALMLSIVVDKLTEAREDSTEHKNRLEALLRRMPAVLWSVDKDLKFVFIRGTLVGDEHGGGDRLIGVSLQKFFQTEDPGFPALAAHREALAGKSADYRQNWEDVIYQCHVDPMRNAAGQVVGVVGVAQDVTRDLEAEEGIQRARKMEALSRLASRTAHDFNNSLTAILGYCDLVLADMTEEDERRADIRAIEKAALNAARMSERLTVFSRHHMNNARPLDVNALIQQVDADLGNALSAQIARVYRLEPALPLVKVDPGQLREILRQLAVNARDAMPGGGKLVIATQRRAGAGSDGRPAADGDHVRITVHDEGPGLSKEARAHLFEPYFSTRSTEKDKGLGLAVCYGLMRQNDGHISFQSAAGKGTAFHLDFPVWTGVPAAAPAAPSTADGKNPGGVETLLLAEDEEDVRTAMARVLTALGYTVLAAENGREALRLLEQDKDKKVRLLLSDVVMPGMNGVDLAKEVHARRPDVRRLLMSGYAERSLLAEGTLPPATAFLQKPFPYTVLARRIRDILDVSTSTDLLK